MAAAQAQGGPGADMARLAALARTLDARHTTSRTRLAQSCPGAFVPHLPAGTDWWWRPGPWRSPLCPGTVDGPASGQRIDDLVSLFHDGAAAGIALHQTPAGATAAEASFAIALEVGEFAGNFVSLAIDLPPAATEGLGRRHILYAGIRAETAEPCPLFVRLNLRHGPNAEKIVREIGPAAPVAEFDLAQSDIDERRLTSVWLDLIADRPVNNEVRYLDVILARYPRGTF
jgi:hypothetical protein